MRTLMIAAGLALAMGAAPALAQNTDVERVGFKQLYKELVEIDTSPTTGSCTRAATWAKARLESAGFGADELHLIVPEGKPDDGNIVAVLKTRQADRAPLPIILLAHIDVVDAKRADWERDPFKLFEEDGYFYGRGAADDKSMAAIFLDMMMRMKREGFSPKRDLVMALTCGEETSNRVNGVDYILKNKPNLFRAAFALNEGGGGQLSDDGKPMWLTIGAGQKIHQVVTLEAVNPGGHSSRPTPDNAIYQLSMALKKIEAYAFPVEINDVVKASFAARGPLEGGKIGAAMTAAARNPSDALALAVLAADPDTNPQLRTTCVATQLAAGHAPNALPQRARATLSCRTLQTLSGDDLVKQLTAVVNDPAVKVALERKRDSSPPAVLTEEFMGPVRKATQKMWPGLPIVPAMGAGANDGRFLLSAGVQTYGVSGILSVPGEANAHGLNEKIRTKSLYDGRMFLEMIVRDYAG